MNKSQETFMYIRKIHVSIYILFSLTDNPKEKKKGLPKKEIPLSSLIERQTNEYF